MIRKNLEKPEDWHYQNLINNNCQLSKIKIKNILQKFRDINYPKDDEYLLDISKIRIDFSKTNPKLQNMNFFSQNKL